MATDYVVTWNERKPEQHQVPRVVVDYFNGAAKIDQQEGRLLIELGQDCRNPLLSISDMAKSLPNWQRCMEVWEDAGRTCLYIITRQQDDYTNALAKGLAEVFRRYWQGTLDPM